MTIKGQKKKKEKKFSEALLIHLYENYEMLFISGVTGQNIERVLTDAVLEKWDTVLRHEFNI